MSLFSKAEQTNFRKGNVVYNALKSTKTYLTIDTKALFSRGFVWFFALLLSALMLYLYAMSNSFVHLGQEVISESSSWSGVRRAEQGFLIDPQSAGPSIAEVGINLKPKRRYAVEVNATCKPGIQYRVDFYGQGYDFPEQEASFQCGDKTNRFIVKSRTPPETASLRIFFLSPDERVQVNSVRVYKLPSSWSAIRKLLLVCSGLVLPIAALYLREYRMFTALSLGVGVLFVYMNYAIGPQIGNLSDSRWYIPTAMSILQSGNIDLSEFSDLLKAYENYGTMVSPEFGRIGSFPIGASIVALPFTFIATFFHAADLEIAVAVANIIATLSAVVLFLLAGNLGCSLLKSLFIAGLFAFGTSQFSTHAGGLWSHNVVVLASLLALLILTSREKKWVLALPFVLFIGYLSRPDFSLVIMATLAYQVITDKERALQVAAMLAILMLAFFTWSYLGYGDILPPYYRSSRLGLSDFGEHLMGQMFSPNRGLFVFNPIFVLSFWGGVLAFRRDIAFKWLYRTIAVVCLLFFTAVACFPHWWGGFLFGPRLHAPVLGLLSVLIVPALNELPRSMMARRGLIAFVILASAWGVFVHGKAAVRMAVHEWNFKPNNVDLNPERLWDWTDMQIFR